MMQGWIGEFQRSIDYIERHLDERLDIADIADKAALSPFYYQRIFGALCGLTVGEYIRGRRMTQAAQELSCTDVLVIDVAHRYGYDSPDSFTKAFQRFHGITPMRAREAGAHLRSISPLHIKVSLEGGNMLEYQIKEVGALTICGIRRRIDVNNSHKEIPEFWSDPIIAQSGLMGKYGLCVDDEGELDYWIADDYVAGSTVGDGCEVTTVPAGLWAQFTCARPKLESLQRLNDQIWSEWLPSLKGYTLTGTYNLEVYECPRHGEPEPRWQIWIPLTRED